MIRRCCYTEKRKSKTIFQSICFYIFVSFVLFIQFLKEHITITLAILFGLAFIITLAMHFWKNRQNQENVISKRVDAPVYHPPKLPGQTIYLGTTKGKDGE